MDVNFVGITLNVYLSKVTGVSTHKGSIRKCQEQNPGYLMGPIGQRANRIKEAGNAAEWEEFFFGSSALDLSDEAYSDLK